MKKQILFVLMMICATSVMAVSLPNNPYNPATSGATYGNDSYTLGTGTSFANTSVVGEYVAGTCQVDKQDPQVITKCEDCCIGAVFGSGGSQDEADYLACINDCMGVSLPLDAPTAFLLALVAAYGAVAVYRRKTNATVA